MNPRATVLARLFTDLLKDYLSEFSYYAEVAGLHYGFDIQTDGLIVRSDYQFGVVCLLNSQFL